MDVLIFIGKYVGVPAAVIAAILACAWLMNAYTSIFLKREEYDKREAISDKVHDGIASAVEGNTAMLSGQINRVSRDLGDRIGNMDKTLTEHHTNIYNLIKEQDKKIDPLTINVAVLNQKFKEMEK